MKTIISTFCALLLPGLVHLRAARWGPFNQHPVNRLKTVLSREAVVAENGWSSFDADAEARIL
jgi:hypothetical protein